MLSLIYDWVYVLFQKWSKVQHFKEFIPKAFPTGDDLILDAEVLLVDNKTSKPLPFGTLGVHKVRFFSLGFFFFWWEGVYEHEIIFLNFLCTCTNDVLIIF